MRISNWSSDVCSSDLLMAWHQAELTRRDSLVHYAYGITAALLAGGAAATLALQQPVGAQAPQNQPGAISAATPRPGAPMSFADLATRLQPAVVNISTTQKIQVNRFPGFPSGTPFDEFFRQFEIGRASCRERVGQYV